MCFPGGRRREVEGRQTYQRIFYSCLESHTAWAPPWSGGSCSRKSRGSEQVCRSSAHQGPQLLYGTCSFCGTLGNDAPVERVRLLFVLLLLLLLLPETHWGLCADTFSVADVLLIHSVKYRSDLATFSVHSHPLVVLHHCSCCWAISSGCVLSRLWWNIHDRSANLASSTITYSSFIHFRGCDKEKLLCHNHTRCGRTSPTCLILTRWPSSLSCTCHFFLSTFDLWIFLPLCPAAFRRR